MVTPHVTNEPRRRFAGHDKSRRAAQHFARKDRLDGMVVTDDIEMRIRVERAGRAAL
jgi:hypothetical protein